MSLFFFFYSIFYSFFFGFFIRFFSDFCVCSFILFSYNLRLWYSFCKGRIFISSPFVMPFFRNTYSRQTDAIWLFPDWPTPYFWLTNPHSPIQNFWIIMPHPRHPMSLHTNPIFISHSIFYFLFYYIHIYPGWRHIYLYFIFHFFSVFLSIFFI